MDLRQTIEKLLATKERNLTWLAKQIGMGPKGLKLALINETLQFGYLVKIAIALDVPPTAILEATPNITQRIKGNNNKQLNNSMMAAEPDVEYKREIDHLREKVQMQAKMIEILENQLKKQHT